MFPWQLGFCTSHCRPASRLHLLLLWGLLVRESFFGDCAGQPGTQQCSGLRFQCRRLQDLGIPGCPAKMRHTGRGNPLEGNPFARRRSLDIKRVGNVCFLHQVAAQAVAFPDADALKRALKQNLSCLAVTGVTGVTFGMTGSTFLSEAKRPMTCPCSTGRQVFAKGHAVGEFWAWTVANGLWIFMDFWGLLMLVCVTLSGLPVTAVSRT